MAHSDHTGFREQRSVKRARGHRGTSGPGAESTCRYSRFSLPRSKVQGLVCNLAMGTGKWIEFPDRAPQISRASLSPPAKSVSYRECQELVPSLAAPSPPLICAPAPCASTDRRAPGGARRPAERLPASRRPRTGMRGRSSQQGRRPRRSP